MSISNLFTPNVKSYQNINCNNLNVANTYLSNSVSFNGPWSFGTATGAISLVNISGIVFGLLNLGQFSVHTGTNVPITCASGTIPNGFRPQDVQQYPIHIINNSVGAAGLCSINTDGSIDIYADMNGSSFTASGVAGFYTITICWNINQF